MRTEVWCNNCLSRFVKKGGHNNPVAVCRNCKHVTLVVTCPICQETSEIAQPKANATWCCLTCKDERYFEDGVLAAYISAEKVAAQLYREERQQFRQLQLRTTGEKIFDAIVLILFVVFLYWRLSLF